MASDCKRSPGCSGELRLATTAVLWHCRRARPRHREGCAFPKQFFNQRTVQHHPIGVNAYANAHSDTNGNPQCDPNSHTKRDANSHPDCNSKSTANSDTAAGSNAATETVAPTKAIIPTRLRFVVMRNGV